MINEILQDCRKRMQSTVDSYRRELGSLRAGRASPNLLEKIRVEYYGAQLPINQLATISVPEPRLIVIQPWDQGALGDIERAILKSDLGLTPNNDGKLLRLAIPQLTEERRQELVRQIRKLAEESRVAVRNIRRDGNDMLKGLEREGDASEDEARRGLDEVQKLTDEHVGQIDAVLETKERELLEV